jgi:3-hydroxyisobutyrate dehydrogenase
MATSTKPVVGFIGLGNMGKPMAKNVCKAGYPLIIFDIISERMEELKQVGARGVSGPKEVADKAEIIITMLPSPSAVQDVIMGKHDKDEGWPGLIEGIRHGKIVIDMSTNKPTLSARLAEEVRRKGGEMIDASVSGSVKPATDGTLVILAGGKRETLEKVRPVLETMGKKIWYIGGNGTGCFVKLALNMHLATMMVSFAECFAFGAKSGLDPAVMLEIFNNSIMKTYVSETKGQKVLNADWSTAFALSLMAKDIDLAAESAKDVKMPLPLLSAAREVYHAAMANAKDDLDFSAVATQIEQMANVKIASDQKA